MSEIKLAVLSGAKVFGNKVDVELKRLNKTNKSYIIDMEEVCFSMVKIIICLQMNTMLIYEE